MQRHHWWLGGRRKKEVKKIISEDLFPARDSQVMWRRGGEGEEKQDGKKYYRNKRGRDGKVGY